MGLSEENVGTLEEAARKRQERLAALKKRKRKNSEGVGEKDEELPTSQVLFRNYKPSDEKLEEVVVPQAEPSKIENLIEDQLKYAEADTQVADVEINSLAPKKPTYDLRRGIETQLERLEKKTDKAIAELIRERLKEGKQQDFLMAVNIGAKQQQKQSLDSDED